MSGGIYPRNIPGGNVRIPLHPPYLLHAGGYSFLLAACVHGEADDATVLAGSIQDQLGARSCVTSPLNPGTDSMESRCDVVLLVVWR